MSEKFALKDATGKPDEAVVSLDDARRYIDERRRAEASRSYLDRFVSAVTLQESRLLDEAEQLYRQAKTTQDKGASARLKKELGERLEQDRQNTAWRNEIAHYGGGFLKTATLFMRGKLGLAGTVGFYALDQMRAGDDAATQLVDGVLGGAKGGLLKGTFTLLGKAEAGVAAKGVGLGVSSRVLDLGLSRETYLNQGSGQVDLAFGLKSIGHGAFNKQAVASDVIIFAAAHGLMGAANKVTAGAIRQSQLLSSMLTGGTFGVSSGAYGELMRQHNGGEPLDLSKVIARGLLHGAVDSLAGGAGHKLSVRSADLDLRLPALEKAQALRFGADRKPGDPSVFDAAAELLKGNQKYDGPNSFRDLSVDRRLAAEPRGGEMKRLIEDLTRQGLEHRQAASTLRQELNKLEGRLQAANQSTSEGVSPKIKHRAGYAQLELPFEAAPGTKTAELKASVEELKTRIREHEEAHQAIAVRLRGAIQSYEDRRDELKTTSDRGRRHRSRREVNDSGVAGGQLVERQISDRLASRRALETAEWELKHREELLGRHQRVAKTRAETWAEMDAIARGEKSFASEADKTAAMTAAMAKLAAAQKAREGAGPVPYPRTVNAIAEYARATERAMQSESDTALRRVMAGQAVATLEKMLERLAISRKGLGGELDLPAIDGSPLWPELRLVEIRQHLEKHVEAIARGRQRGLTIDWPVLSLPAVKRVMEQVAGGVLPNDHRVLFIEDGKLLQNRKPDGKSRVEFFDVARLREGSARLDRLNGHDNISGYVVVAPVVGRDGRRIVWDNGNGNTQYKEQIVAVYGQMPAGVGVGLPIGVLLKRHSGRPDTTVQPRQRDTQTLAQTPHDKTGQTTGADRLAQTQEPAPKRFAPADVLSKPLVQVDSGDIPARMHRPPEQAGTGRPTAVVDVELPEPGKIGAPSRRVFTDSAPVERPRVFMDTLSAADPVPVERTVGYITDQHGITHAVGVLPAATLRKLVAGGKIDNVDALGVKLYQRAARQAGLNAESLKLPDVELETRFVQAVRTVLPEFRAEHPAIEGVKHLWLVEEILQPRRPSEFPRERKPLEPHTGHRAVVDAVLNQYVGQYVAITGERKNIPLIHPKTIEGILKQSRALDGQDLTLADFGAIGKLASRYRRQAGYQGGDIIPETAELYIRVGRALGLTRRDVARFRARREIGQLELLNTYIKFFRQGLAAESDR